MTESKDGGGESEDRLRLDMNALAAVEAEEKAQADAAGPRFTQTLEPVEPTVLGLPEDFDFGTAENEFKLERYEVIAFKRLRAGNYRASSVMWGSCIANFARYTDVALTVPPLSSSFLYGCSSVSLFRVSNLSQ